MHENPSLRNWFLNETMNLCCSRRFLFGTYSSPQLSVDHTFWNDNPYFDTCEINMRFIKGYVHPIIREFINNGYYVFYWGIDDYYLEGKSFYNERHFNHDGLICGYDQNNKTYQIYAYDQKWIYRQFDVKQSSFDKGRLSAFRQNDYGSICGIKARSDHVELSPARILYNLRVYLYSTYEMYPLNEDGLVFGVLVHDFLKMYIDKLADGSILHERMDWRVFRMFWEHKVVMLERIQKLEVLLGFDSKLSISYKEVVKEANTIRMLYASHHQKRRDHILPSIANKIMNIKAKELEILPAFINTLAERVTL